MRNCRLIPKYLIVAIGLLISLGYTNNESIITIVDISDLDRNGIAKELGIINKYSPKVIGLNFLLTTDSLDKDFELSKQVSRAKNLVQASTLHSNDEKVLTEWDSLERYHSKFNFGSHGFSNISITHDSVIISELPMQQYYKREPVYAFSYMVAKMYNEGLIDSKYKNNHNDFSFDSDIMKRHFKIISVKDLMTENFDSKDLKGRIVLMGHISDSVNSFFLDKQRTQKISGTEVQASFITAIMN